MSIQVENNKVIVTDPVKKEEEIQSPSEETKPDSTTEATNDSWLSISLSLKS